MAIYTLTFDLEGTFSAERPLFQVWYGGAKLLSSYAEATSAEISIEIDTDATFNHSELRFHFVPTGTEPSRQVIISNIHINGADLDSSEFYGSGFDTTATSITLDKGEYANYLTTNEIPEIADNKPNIQGSSGNDKLHGDYLGENINGQDGHDALYGGGGNDDIYGGAGQDIISGEDGDDRLYGGADNDRVYGGAGNDRIEGNDGNDRLEGGAGDDTIYGGAGNDVIVSGDGDDIVYGEDGDDLIYGTAGSRNELYGGNGLDKIYGGAGDDRLDGGADRDIIGGYAGDDNIYGGDGDDHVDGGDGNDNVFGDAGNDRVYGQDGNDNVRGGAGDDFVFGNSGTDTVYGDDGNDVVAGGNDNDFVYGGNDNDIVHGEDGNDRVEGNNGDDAVSGGFGADVILGGAGNDMLYGGGMDGYDITLLQQVDSTLLFNHATQSVYKIITTTEQWDNAETAAAAETINGVAGSLLSIESALENAFILNELGLAGATSTWLAASDNATEGTWTWNTGQMAGLTFFDGGATQNLIYSNFAVGEGSTGNQDFLMMNASGEWEDAVNGAQSAYVIEWNYEDLMADNSVDQIFGGTGNDVIYGGGGKDTIKGEDGDDLIFGQIGADTISGNAGSDIIYGGEGNDTINGGAEIDTIFGGAGNDRIFFDMRDIVDGGANFDTLQLDASLSGDLDFSNLTSIEHIALDNYQGNAAANTLTLSYADVVSISGSNTLYISADLGLDIVTVTDLDAENQYVGTTIVDGTIYERYTDGSVNIYMELGLVTANQAFLIDPVNVTTLANSVDINTGSYLAKTTGVAFETGGDINTTQVIYEQGGGTRGLNFYIEGGNLHMAAWNFQEENWGYKEVTVAIEANTRYTTSMVFDGAFPQNGTIEGFLNGTSIGTVTGVGNLYAHTGGISIGQNDNTVIGGSTNNNVLTFSGDVGKLGQYNVAYSGAQLDGFHDFLASNWLIDPDTNTAPEATDDVATVTSGTITTIAVLLNDSDPDGHPISIDSVGSAANGTVILNQDGSLTYQSNIGFTGSDSFTYTITDSVGTDTATVNITVNPSTVTINDPSEIADLTIWYDANDVASYIDTGSDLILEGINDKSANNLDATQGTASAKPNVVNIDGDSWIEFDGNDMLVIPNSALLNSNGPYDGKTISMSFRTGADINTRQVIYEQGGGTRGMNFFIDGGELYLNGWNRAETYWGPAYANATLEINTTYVATMVYNGVAGTLTGYLNGTIIGTVSGLDLLYNHTDAIALGGINGSTYFLTNGNGGNNFSGHIGEVAIYNSAITADERVALDQYMTGKWLPEDPPSFEVTPDEQEAPPLPSNPGMTLVGNSANDQLTGSENDDMLYGDSGLDRLIGGLGNDVIEGGDDNDELFGDDRYTTSDNDGDDVLNGGAGRDTLSGGGGDDILYFGEGADYLYGNSGADIFRAYETAGKDNDMAFAMDFSALDGDRVDLSNLLSGFDPDSDDISDFINVAQGYNTTFQVDRDGAGGQYGWDNVLRLQSITDLETDVQTLIDNGTLII